jgi:hypothetical protein
MKKIVLLLVLCLGVSGTIGCGKKSPASTVSQGKDTTVVHFRNVTARYDLFINPGIAGNESIWVQYRNAENNYIREVVRYNTNRWTHNISYVLYDTSKIYLVCNAMVYYAFSRQTNKSGSLTLSINDTLRKTVVDSVGPMQNTLSLNLNDSLVW